MNIIEGAIILIIMANLGATWIMGRALARVVKDESTKLGFQTAEAMQAAIGSLSGLDIEQPNPVQAAVAQFIQSRLAPTAKIENVTELSRDQQGKFS